ncbi:CaiB/BaiF CoA transferase family protein [Comamonas terrigena]|uniref:CaiB/BaiF CoA transferase family protein n=1 Tax=Comamonas terrigena TaxID=32013 RepID=UPI002447E5C4|nr:CaiB/BaiF CoA-transferase family protein [Comamonas terrigena]MDH0047433.1 CoA transferase [Comamonas terrigena]MDH0509853.1 CoA transferase [Comamonas terrigena]MDH1089768.1 CoA transferase [Comamonas terrigena]MDH1501637.1 CoA transferase [Comamonas terrigena]
MTASSPASTPAASRPAALAGIKVLDLSRVLAGPWATQLLADLGADVVKVERPVAGDDTRHWGPPFLKDTAGNDTREASYFTACNRNKRSITVDMAHPEGQALLRRMAAEADVVVENFKVGGLQQYGLDYDSLKALNPRLIYCSITGFGQDGPYAERAGYDLMVQAMCGLMSITGHADHEPGGGPLKVGVAVIDVFTGLYASNAIIAALHARDNAGHGSGEGQYIDMALLDVGMAVLANQAAGYLATDKAPGRAGNIHPSLAPYQDFKTRDGNVLLAIGNDGQFARFCAAAGHPGWAQDARFATNTARVQNRSDLLMLMTPLMQTRGTQDWITLLEDKAVPCGPINTVAQAFDDPQVRARGIRKELPAAGGLGTVGTVASPMRLSGTPVVYRSAPPSLGQHTTEVLTEMGLDAAQLAQLQAQQVI